MTVFLAVAVLCLSPTVHDGDTIRCGSERVRIANIDAPELPDSPK
ncbi:MAG: nuclease, partial [Novosphingobium sp. 17-62-8]